MKSIALGASILALAASLSACGGSGSTATKTVTRTVTATATVTETAEATDTADAETTSEYVPTKADFTLGLKILSKECFGSAGCNLEFRLKPSYTGEEFDPGQTVEVTYQIVGSEDPYTNTFTMTGDTNASVNERESVQTGTAGKISAKVTDVELVNFSD